MIERSGPLYQKVYDVFWEKILSGQIRPGQRLKDISWAQELNVSRTPVREAMRKLEQEGLLKALSKTGFQLRRLSIEDLQDLYECRAVLEGLAARYAARTATSSDLKRLRNTIKLSRSLISNGEFEGAFQQHTLFHDIITNKSSNEYLIDVYESIRRKMLYCRRSLMELVRNHPDGINCYRSHLLNALVHHRQIVLALESGDEEHCERLMREHVRDTATAMMQILRSLPQVKRGGESGIDGMR